MDRKLLVVGETNVDVVLHGVAAAVPGQEVLADDCVLTLGSASAICAMGLARLGNVVAFVSRVGADFWGDYCVRLLQAAGIDTSHVHRQPGLKTGVTVSMSSPADRALVTYLGSIATVAEPDVPDALLDEGQHLHVSSYFLQARLRPACGRLFMRARARGLTTSLDPGCDPDRQWRGPAAIMESIDVLLLNEIELANVTGCGEPAAGLAALANGRTRVVVKLGCAGAMTLEQGDIVRAPAFEIEPIDTTGAGDSFNAGFLHAFVRGASVRDCLSYGNACGALSTRGIGGTACQPTLDELTHLVNTRALRA
jgi:sugar/nucleoside kinase (ribokinase family)